MSLIPMSLAAARQMGVDRARYAWNECVRRGENPLAWEPSEWFKGASVRMSYPIEREAKREADAEWRRLRADLISAVRRARRRKRIAAGFVVGATVVGAAATAWFKSHA